MIVTSSARRAGAFPLACAPFRIAWRGVVMMLRLTTCAAVMLLSLSGVGELWAHEGHTHVMGTVTAVNDGRLVVHTRDGQAVAIQIDGNTRYRVTGVATSSGMIRVGDRVVVEVTEEANGLRAAEVRYAAAAQQAP